MSPHAGAFNSSYHSKLRKTLNTADEYSFNGLVTNMKTIVNLDSSKMKEVYIEMLAISAAQLPYNSMPAVIAVKCY
jgi:hypothetical protein